MKIILEFLISDGEFIYKELNFRMIDSQYVDQFGGTGWITFRNDKIELLLWLERDHLYIEFRASGDKRKFSWISLDIIKQILTGEIDGSARMIDENIDYVKTNFLKIQDLFSPEHRQKTEKDCKMFQSQRAKRLFG